MTSSGDYSDAQRASDPSRTFVDAAQGRSTGGGSHEVVRFQLLMGLGGFLGGLALVVPAVLWMAAESRSPGSRASNDAQPFVTAAAVSPALVSAPTRTGRSARPPVSAEAYDDTLSRSDREAVVIARQLIRGGDIAGARRVLSTPALATDGEAVFMLAETYDPNVLAALGVTGVMAEAPTARRLYTVAGALGMSAAQRRLEQLQ